MKKFNYDERKAKDLLEWHKDSHPLTKDENGVPKVFYHGTSSDKVFEVFNKDKIHSGYGFWFGDDIADRAVKENTTGKAPIIKAFLQMKKPFIFSNQGITAQNIDEYAYITGISKKRITELYEAKEAFNTLEKMIQRDTQADYVWAGAVDYFEIEKGGKELNIFDYRQLDLSDQTIAFLDRMRTKGITARGFDISPTRQYESAQEARETLERLKEKGYDSMVYANSEFVVFDSNQIKHIENRGVESESGRKYFNDSSPNIFQSNHHLGAGLLGGSVAGVEQDENGNLTFSPEKFALGLLGGAGGSIAISKAHKKFLQSKPQKIIPFINKQKYPHPRFEVTKELEKTYRNAQVKPNEKIKETLKLSGIVKGDFIKLAQKHPEYFASPQEAKELCDYVFENAFIGLQASDKKQALIIAKLQDSNNDYGSVAFRVQNINGEHRIRSVMLMEQKQVDLKVENAKKLGEPIFHFW